MAKDCLAVLDTLHWQHAHIVGHSMGGMIAVKLASLAPTRVSSLTVISTSAGGWDALLPRSWRQFKMGWKMVMARDEQTRTRRTLKAHFTKEMLDELVGCVLWVVGCVLWVVLVVGLVVYWWWCGVYTCVCVAFLVCGSYICTHSATRHKHQKHTHSQHLNTPINTPEHTYKYT